MKQEFIPYEQALEIKKLGFDEPCLGYYDSDGFQLGRSPGNPNNINSQFSESTNNPKISAPLKQQGFSWIFQQMNIDVGAVPLNENFQGRLFEELIESYLSQ